MMKCSRLKKIIPIYLDGELDPRTSEVIKNHLTQCLVCKEVRAQYAKTWNLLKHSPEIEPNPKYVSRFWTELSLRSLREQQIPWYKNLLQSFGQIRQVKHWVRVGALMSVMMGMGFFALQNYSQLKGSEGVLASLNKEDLQLLGSLELAEHYEVISDLDFFENFDVIEDLDKVTKEV